MRSISVSSGGVKCKSAGRRPSTVTEDSRMIASASHPSGRSRCRAQVTAVATPSRTNATVVRFCRAARTLVTLLCSGGAEPVDGGHLAHEEVHNFWIPLMAGAVEQHRQSSIDREPRAVRAVVAELGKCGADRDDPPEPSDLASAQTVRAAPAVDTLVV